MKARRLSTALAVFGLTIMLAGSAQALCMSFEDGPPCQAYWHAQAVFIGTVKKVTYSDIYQRGEGDSRRNYRRRITRFSVETAYKGVEGKVAEVVTEEQMWVPDVPADGEQRAPMLMIHPPRTDCDYVFDVGETYFVYANLVSKKDGTLNVPMNRTGKLEDAAADLKFVNELPRAAPTASIFGRIVRADLSVALGEQKRLPLAGIKVTARSGKRTFEALTDAGGKYELKDLPPGSYQVTPAYPAHLSADSSRRAQVVARGCAELDFDTRSNVRLKGRVIDAEGRPLLGVKVGLIHAEATEVAREGLYTWTAGDGDYGLRGIPAGRFLLFFDLPSAPGARVPHPPRAYYPGVWSAAQATAITVADGVNLPAYDLQLLPPPDRAVEIVLTWPDGRPVGNAWVTLEDPDYDWEGSMTGAKKVDGQEGRYQATGFDGITYWARAHVNVEGGVGQMHAEPVKFTLREGAGPIKLVVTEPGGHCPHYRRK